MTEQKKPILLVTGLSGAGISSCLKVLEDQGFEAVDNLPVYLLERVIEARKSPMAVSIDVRNRDFHSSTVGDTVDRLRDKYADDLSVVFIDCSDDELIGRFSKTKRAHPLAKENRVVDGISSERSLLRTLFSRADYLLDTTGLSVWQFKERLLALDFQRPEKNMRVRVVSFSYGKGLPRDADVVIDVRFLRNPFYVEELREHNGLHPEVAAYVFADPRFDNFWRYFSDLLRLSLQGYEAEGKSYFTLAVGCTGGKHRSVAVAEKAAKDVFADYTPQVFHREERHDDKI